MAGEIVTKDYLAHSTCEATTERFFVVDEACRRNGELNGMRVTAATRIKKSYSISQESEQFIRRVRKTAKIASDSAALDHLLHEAMESQAREARNAACKASSDEVSDEELKEANEWAEFAELEFAELSKAMQ